jgi:hypothetical protein
MKLTLLAALGACALALSSPSVAQQAPAPLFASSDPVHLVIQAPLSSIIGNRESQAVISGTLTEPSGQVLPITLSLRGLTRRSSDTCDFPPLRVDFPQRPPPGSLFAGQTKLKLVTHCRNPASFQQYVLLEYSAYRMYNLLTPRSFRVRLADIDYRDANGRPIISRVGYFMEELKDVARRNGMRVVHAGQVIPVADLSPPDAARYALFQHMIANHDWSMRAGPAGKDCCHNAELIGIEAPGMTVPIPYDFDYSGFVSAPYATPPDQLHLTDVRERMYRGYCAHSPQVIEAARQMRALQPQLIAAITSTPGLEPGTQNRAIHFLDRFFTDISSDQSVAAKVINRCVGG